MSERYAELKELTAQFVDAFNRQDLDAVVDFFADDAIYDDSRGNPHHGRDAIREAFAPLLSGKIRFDDEDYFAELETEKVLTSWTLTLEAGGEPKKMRGLDILQFRDDKIIRKLAYCKADKPRLD